MGISAKEAIENLRKIDTLGECNDAYRIGEIACLIEKMQVAMRIAYMDLITSNNLLATDRPELIPKDYDNIVWMTDNSYGIEALEGYQTK